MEIAGYKIYSLSTGSFGLDGGAMFGIIPKPLWERSNPPDEKNRVALAANVLLLIGNSKKILIDTGMGDKWNEKSRKIYNINQDYDSLQKSLSQLQINNSEITDVILTHLHFDHAGGATQNIDEKIVPSFPNAKYYVQKKNFKWAMNATERDKGSYLKENFLPLLESGVLNLVDENFQFDITIDVILINGHTFGQQLVRISDKTNTLLFCGDLLPFTSHLNLPYIMGYDLQPLVTLNEKKQILHKAAKENWKLFFEHDPLIKCADIKFTDKGYALNNEYKF